MYTICSSCGVEICFIPPVNLEALPENYKHRVMCPHCGVTVIVTKKDIVELSEDDDYCAPSTVANVITESKKYRSNANSAKINRAELAEHNKKVKDYNSAYDRYVDLLADKLEHGGSTARIFAVALKTVIITLFICACVLTAVGIAAFVLYMLSGTEKIALSSSVEYIVDFYWIYGAVGFVVGLLLFWANTCVDVKKKDKVIDSKRIADAKREWKQSERALKKSINKLNKRRGDICSTLNIPRKEKPQYAAISRQNSKYPKKSISISSTQHYTTTYKKQSFVDRLTAWSDKMAYGDIMEHYRENKRCGKCRWYEASDAQGYAPGYCRRHSRTALWGDSECEDFEW